MCYTLREADEILAANARAGTVCLVAYMKRYDPAVRYAAPLLRRLPDLRAIQITVLHPSEANQTGHHDLRRFADVPGEAAALLRGTCSPLWDVLLLHRIFHAIKCPLAT